MFAIDELLTFVAKPGAWAPGGFTRFHRFRFPELPGCHDEIVAPPRASAEENRFGSSDSIFSIRSIYE